MVDLFPASLRRYLSEAAQRIPMTEQNDLDGLEALAKKATQGEWVWSLGDTYSQVNKQGYEGNYNHKIAECHQWRDPEYGPTRAEAAANAAYIAAANPQAILALISECRTLRARVEKMATAMKQIAEAPALPFQGEPDDWLQSVARAALAEKE